MPKIVHMLLLVSLQLAVFSVFFCKYLLISILSDLQGWLTVISAPYRPRPHSVAVDGKQWLPWLRSLCVSLPEQWTHSPRGRCVCVCEWVCLNAWVCVLMCFDLTERYIPEENVTSSGKNWHARWCEQMVKEDEERYSEAGESFINSPKTQFHRTASPQHSDQCACIVCLRCNSLWLVVVAAWTLTTCVPVILFFYLIFMLGVCLSQGVGGNT